MLELSPSSLYQIKEMNFVGPLQGKGEPASPLQWSSCPRPPPTSSPAGQWLLKTIIIIVLDFWVRSLHIRIHKILSFFQSKTSWTGNRVTLWVCPRKLCLEILLVHLRQRSNVKDCLEEILWYILWVWISFYVLIFSSFTSALMTGWKILAKQSAVSSFIHHRYNMIATDHMC